MKSPLSVRGARKNRSSAVQSIRSNHAGHHAESCQKVGLRSALRKIVYSIQLRWACVAEHVNVRIVYDSYGRGNGLPAGQVFQSESEVNCR